MEVFREEAGDFGADGAGGVFLFVAGGFDRDDDVGFDFGDGAAGLVGDLVAPALLVAGVAAVADEVGGVFGVVECDVGGGAVFEDEFDAAFGEGGGDIPEALQHEGVVAGVGFGVVVGEAKADDERFFLGIRGGDGVF